MNNNHPLTDEILHDNFNGFYDPGKLCGYSIFDADDMRAVADDQLEQVIKWLDENIAHYHYRQYYETWEFPSPSRGWDKLTEHLKEAMRPATTQEDS